jgi:ABC-2 type transport system ATP-binding protein
MKTASLDTDAVIYTEGLVKTFGAFRALDGLDLTVRRGEVHGFLGPNGAGKSTTIRVLLGLLRKTSGQVSLFGQDPWSEAVDLHRSLAYVPGDASLWQNLSGGEVIDLFGRLRGGIDKRRRQQLLDDFQLDARKKCGTYSKGNRQKVALVAALASDVDLYILDEPTSGLDPLMEAVFQDHIKKLKQQGKTILLSSHILAEVETLADTVTIIRDGKTVENGPLSHLRHLSQHTVKATVRKDLVGLDRLPGIHSVQTEGKRQVQFGVEHKDLGASIEYLAGFGIESLVSEPQSLEELFMKHYDTSGKR